MHNQYSEVNISTIDKNPIDDIGLYNNGYATEKLSDDKSSDENMINLIPPPFQQTANPVIVESTGYTDGSESVALILFANTGGRGYVRLHGVGKDTTFTDIVNCYTNKVAIVHLEELHIPTITDTIDITAFRCRQEVSQDCSTTPPICTDEIQSGSAQTVNTKHFDPTKPDSPGPLKITPGSTILNVEWNPVTNTDIFAYGIRALLGGEEAKSGYVPSSFTNVVIPQLANERDYTVEVFALSSSNIKSDVAFSSGTPTRKLIAGEILPGPSGGFPGGPSAVSSPNITPFGQMTTLVLSVSDSDGNPINDASVFIDNNYIGSTDNTGGVIIDNISSRTVHIFSIKAKGFNDVQQESALAPGVTYVSLQMILAGGKPESRAPLAIIPLETIPLDIDSDENKVLHFKEMQNMSIDDIVKLYKDGYIIEIPINPIKSLQTIDGIPDKYVIVGLGIFVVALLLFR